MMRKMSLFISILFFSFLVKGQKWDTGFVRSLEKYYFIPVTFERFGKWIADIEIDSSILFKTKILTNVNDSVYLHFDLQKRDATPSFENSTLTIKIKGNTIVDKRVKLDPRSKNLVRSTNLPPVKVTTLNIYACLSFDSTFTGRFLATNAQKELENQFDTYFAKKQVTQRNKNIHKRKFHREEERTAYFKRENDLIPMFRIRTNNFPDENRVELCLSYELTH